jgi:hypothetical protein
MKLLKRYRNKKSREDGVIQNDVPIGMKINIESRSSPQQMQEIEESRNLLDQEGEREAGETREESEKRSSSILENMIAKTQEQLKSEGPFDLVCGYVESAFGVEDTKMKRLPEGFARFGILKEDKSEKVGLSFVSFEDKKGIYVCKIKDHSKFLETGLRPGMRIVAINGRSCPDRVGQLLKLVKKATDVVEIIAETQNVLAERVLDPDEEESTLAESTVARSIHGNRFYVSDEDLVSSHDGSSWDDITQRNDFEDDGNMEVLMDIMLGQHEAKELNNNVMNNMAFIVDGMKKGQPLWMYLE